MERKLLVETGSMLGSKSNNHSNTNFLRKFQKFNRAVLRNFKIVVRVCSDYFFEPLNKKEKMYKNVESVYMGEVSKNYFFIKFFFDTLIDFVKDALLSMGVCYVLDIYMKYIIVYAIARTVLVLHSLFGAFFHVYRNR